MSAQRRAFLIFAAAFAAGNVLAQGQRKIWRIGFLTPGRRPPSAPAAGSTFRGFFDGLRALNYVEGRDYTLIRAHADDDVQRLPELARKLVESRVDVIVTVGTPGVLAAQKATTTTPIVALTLGDPVGSGFAVSLARPGGNITGLTVLDGPLGLKKRLEILTSVVSTARRLAYLVNPDNPSVMRTIPQIEVAARKLGKELVTIKARNAGDLVPAFEAMKREGIEAIIVADDAILNGGRRQIGALTVERRLPAIHALVSAAEDALLVYGASFERLGYRGASLVDKILKGAKPGDLPIEGPTEFELIVNLRIAKAIGVTIPDTVMLQATRVIR